MKKLLLSAFCAFSAVIPAYSQLYDTSQLVNNIAIASGGSSNVAAVVGCTRYDEFALQINFKLMASGTDPVTFTWCTSNDGVTYCTTGSGQGTFTVAANGTTPVVFTTNMVMNSVGYFQISSIAGSTNAITTNLTVNAFFKPRKRGP